MKKGLGRGLDALFSIYQESEEEKKVVVEEKKEEVKTTVDQGVVELDMKLVDPNRNQPRKYFEPNALKELSESIKQHGIIQPIIVNKENNGRYTIIAGERRFRASLLAGLYTIPAIVKDYDQKQVKEVALIENLQREDLNPIEAAKAIKQLMIDYKFTQDDVADRIGKSRPLVANTLRLLSLTPEVITMIEKNQISAGHGKCLVSVVDIEKQISLAKLVIEKKLSVRDLENLLKKESFEETLKEIKVKEKNQSIELKELGHRLQRLFRTKIKINGDDNKGKILINYFNRDDLDRISKFISKFED